MIKLAITNLLPTWTVKELEERSKFTVIDPDTSDDEDEYKQKHRHPADIEMIPDINDRKSYSF